MSEEQENTEETTAHPGATNDPGNTDDVLSIPEQEVEGDEEEEESEE